MISDTAVEVSAKTVDEAVEKALNELGIRKDNAEVELLNEPSASFFSFFGNKEARVKVTIKRDPKTFLLHFMDEFFKNSHFDAQTKLVKAEDNHIFLNISGESKNLGILIGKRGETLNALQYLVNVILRSQFRGLRDRVVIDIKNYRQRRAETLKQLALNLAKKVVRTKEPVVLEPMTPQERRIIHIALQGDSRVATQSKGDGYNRKVVISLQ